MKDEGIGLAGWLLADLVLVLAVIFLAIVPGDPEAEPNVAPTWSDVDLGEMRQGSVFNGGFAAEGHPAPTFVVVGGAPPPGIALDAEHGLLHGIPEQEGDYEFTIRATNGVGGGADRSFEVRVRPPDSACRPEASFEFDQVVVESAQGASWADLLAGRVRRGLTKDQELDDVAVAELGEEALSFLIQRQQEGYQIALVETFGGSPDTALAKAVNNELATLLAVEFERLVPPTAASEELAPILLRPDLPREQWSADYQAKNIRPGSARINLYFVKALPPECF